MLRLALGTLTLAIVLSSVCLAAGMGRYFPLSHYPEEVRLAAAVRSGDLSAVKKAAEQVDMHQPLDRRDSLRNYVLRHGSAEIVRYLNRKAELGIEELQIAVIENDLETVKRLVPEKPERPPVVLRSDEHSPLRLAVRHRHAPMVKLLLERNVAVNEFVPTIGVPATRPSVLSDAIQVGNAEIVRLIVETGVKLEEPQEGLVPAEEATPLANAVYAGREQVVAVLLEAGADPNVLIGGQTRPLHLAIQTGHPGVVKLLIDAGADVNQPDAEGRTPLGLGFYKGDVADMLRAAGAKEPPGIEPGLNEPQPQPDEKPEPAPEPPLPLGALSGGRARGDRQLGAR